MRGTTEWNLTHPRLELCAPCKGTGEVPRRDGDCGRGECGSCRGYGDVISGRVWGKRGTSFADVAARELRHCVETGKPDRLRSLRRLADRYEAAVLW